MNNDPKNNVNSGFDDPDILPIASHRRNTEISEKESEYRPQKSRLSDESSLMRARRPVRSPSARGATGPNAGTAIGSYEAADITGAIGAGAANAKSATGTPSRFGAEATETIKTGTAVGKVSAAGDIGSANAAGTAGAKMSIESSADVAGAVGAANRMGMANRASADGSTRTTNDIRSANGMRATGSTGSARSANSTGQANSATNNQHTMRRGTGTEVSSRGSEYGRTSRASSAYTQAGYMSSADRSSAYTSSARTQADHSSGRTTSMRTQADHSSGRTTSARTSAERSSAYTTSARTSAERSSGRTTSARTSADRSSGHTTSARTPAERSSGHTTSARVSAQGKSRRSSYAGNGGAYTSSSARGSRSNTKKGKNTGKRGDQGESTALSSLVKAIIYITCILIVSGTIGFFGISIGNDIFAFVKDDFDATITVSDTTTLTEIAEMLHEKGVIKYPKMFKLYADIRHKTWRCNAGEYTVSPTMNYDTLLVSFKTKDPEKATVRVTIPEGYTVDEIIDLFVEKYGIGTREGFVDAIQNGEYDYWFVNELTDLPEGRKYRLEGYLYPDTYDYYTTAKPETVIAKMLQNFDVKMRTILGKDWETTCKELCKERGMSFDEIVTLASMIQMEAKYEYEYEDISAVFTNRLKNTTVSGGRLQSDATIQYFLDERNADLTQADLDNPNPYNTYLYAGLPPGPITNITINAINYAFYPSNNGYYFFYGHPNGYTMFAKTYAEHQQNIAIAKEAAAAKK